MFLRLDERLRADGHGERAEKGHFHSILEVQLLHNYWRGIEVLVCRISWLWDTYPACTAASSDLESFLPTLALSGARYSRLRYSARCGILFTTQRTVKWDVLVNIEGHLDSFAPSYISRRVHPNPKTDFSPLDLQLDIVVYWICKRTSITIFVRISPSAAFRSICIHLTRFLVSMGGVYQRCPSDCGINLALMMAWSSLMERCSSGGVDWCKLLII